MSECPYQKYYSEYMKGDLPADIDIAFHQHLQECQICAREIELFYKMSRPLQIRHRPKPDRGLITAYHQYLTDMAGSGRDSGFITHVIRELIFTHSRWLRLAEVLSLLCIGILIGWIFFYNDEPQVSRGSAETGYYGKPISKQDMEYLNYYFLASEMMLLEMANGDMVEDEFFLEKETAQKLLIKTFIVHEVALKLNDPKILRFLTRMELILYELSNTEQDQLAETISSVRFIIDEAQLLVEVRELRQLLINSGTPETMPG